MAIQFEIEHAFEGRLQEGTEEPVPIVKGLGRRGEIPGELIDLELEVGIQAGNLRKEGG